MWQLWTMGRLAPALESGCQSGERTLPDKGWITARLQDLSLKEVLGCVSQTHPSGSGYSFPQLPGVLADESSQLSPSLRTILGPRGLPPRRLQPSL